MPELLEELFELLKMPPVVFTLLFIFVIVMLVRTAGTHRRHAMLTDQRLCRGCGLSHPTYANFCRQCGRKL